MPSRKKPSHPGLVVLHEVSEGHWELIGEVRRVQGSTARSARTKAVVSASKGRAKAGDVYAAVLRSEWRMALDWKPKSD